MAAEDLSIDIQLHKLLGWSLERQLAPSNWQARADGLRERIAKLLQEDFPDTPEIAELRSAPVFTYFHCVRLVHLLTIADADTRNIFGQYSSQRINVQQWRGIVEDYEKDGVFFAECASILNQWSTYDIPAVKRGIARANTELQDLDKRKAEYAASAAGYRTKYAAACAELGIKGDDIGSELQGLLGHVPELFQAAVEAVQRPDIEQAISYYREFALFTTQIAESEQVLPLIQYLRTHGNTSVSAWESGGHERIDAPLAHAKGESDTAGPTVGDAAAQAERAQGEEGSTAEAAVIDASVPADTDDGEIDWGDDDIGADADVPVVGITVESEGAALVEQESILGSPVTRNLVLDELYELESFLKQRLAEAQESAETAAVIDEFQNAPAAVQRQTPATMQRLLGSVQEAYKVLINPRAQHIVLALSSPAYITQLTNNLEEKLHWVTRMSQRAELLDSKKAALRESAQAMHPQLARLIAAAKELQYQLEKAISSHYDNRPVHIVGTVNAL